MVSFFCAQELQVYLKHNKSIGGFHESKIWNKSSANICTS